MCLKKRRKIKPDIVHVYHGAMGNNGLYLHEIVNALSEVGYTQEVYVSHYFPFEYGHKWFFKFTDLSGKAKLGKLRPYVRGMELCIGLGYTLIDIWRRKPKVVNYSLIQAFAPEFWFLRILKRFTNAKIVITCHDVVPFANKFMSLEESTKLRKKIFDLADFLLVHNDSSKANLKHFFGIDKNRIAMHPFPLMDISKLYPHLKNPGVKTRDFLYIGHMREEKGIRLLLEAWTKFHQYYPDKKLTIAGTNPNNYDFSAYSDMNVEIIEGFLNDEDYCKLIWSSQWMVLPYLSGTNSGVLSTVVGLGGSPICSDIPMFCDNEMVNKGMLFKSGSSESLCSIMAKLVNNNTLLDTTDIAVNYKSRFKEQVYHAYNKIITPPLTPFNICRIERRQAA